MHPAHNTLSENIRTRAVELLNKHYFFTEISRRIDHQLWLVESHVAPK
jgi:hypothetical protein